jgi:MurNAc alpha-1-phosphate uridylyltransferase
MIIAILAGGLATRLGDLSSSTPKSLLPVAGKPFIGHQLDILSRNGITAVHLCLGHMGDQVADYVGDGGQFGVDITMTFEQEQLLGTAGALALAAPHLGDRFGVLYGDSFLPVKYDAICRAFVERSTPAMMTVWKNGNAFDRSNLVVDNGTVTAYSADRQDTAAYEWIDYGLSFMTSEIIEKIPGDKPTPLSAVWQELVSKRSLAAHVVESRFYEIGSPAGYLELCDLAEQGGMPETENGD